MFACAEEFDRFDNNIVLVEVSDRTVELAEELAAEGADEETIDEFLDNCEESFSVMELLASIARGETTKNEDGTYWYVGEEGSVGLGQTEMAAKAAYVDSRLDCQ